MYKSFEESVGFGDTLNVCTQTQANYTAQISYTSCNGNIINESATNTVFVTGGFQNIPNITNVDCNGNNNGIISDENGFFELVPEQFSKKDSLFISSMGLSCQ